MGCLSVFTCQNCGYSAEVSGGPDRGFLLCTQTMVCLVCREIFDTAVGEWSSIRGEEQKHPPKPIKPRCPKSSTHPLQEWSPTSPCPRCGGPVEHQGVGVLWD